MESYAIADCAAMPGESFYARVLELVEARVDWLQLRAKALSDRDVVAIGVRMRQLIRSRTRFAVNARSDIAAGIGAEAVHLPSSGVPVSAARAVSDALIVGRSCHSVEDCRRARDEGADYVVLGPVFPPRSKEGVVTLTLDDLSTAAALGVPLYAVGGISRESLPALRGKSLAGVAAITLFMEEGPVADVVKMVREL